MAYEINVHVGKDGKLTSDVEPFEISVYRESKRVKLLFEVDAEIDSTYHYLKFTTIMNSKFLKPSQLMKVRGR